MCKEAIYHDYIILSLVGTLRLHYSLSNASNHFINLIGILFEYVEIHL